MLMLLLQSSSSSACLKRISYYSAYHPTSNLFLFAYPFKPQYKSITYHTQSLICNQKNNHEINATNTNTNTTHTTNTNTTPINNTNTAPTNSNNNTNTNTTDTSTTIQQGNKSYFGALKEYGILGLGVYFTIWSSFMVVFYFALSHGLVGYDTVGAIEELGLNRWIKTKNIHPVIANLVGAFLLNKCIEVFRIPTAIFITVRLKKWLVAKNPINKK